ncbi:MAG: hypothetical protein Q8M03_12120, partial [Legionella sp.]|nr:hypothetical protein [Legionella sp.]
DSAVFNEGRTNGEGEHIVQVNIKGMPSPPAALNISASARVIDLNNQSTSSSTSYIVHPSRLYVGLQMKQRFVKAGEEVNLKFIVTDVEGHVVGDVPVHLTLLETVRNRRNRSTEERAVRSIHLISTKDEEGSFVLVDGQKISLESGGTFSWHAQVHDQQDYANESRVGFWVTGGAGARKGIDSIERGSTVTADNLVVVPDKDVYEPGDTARLLVQPPFTPCEGQYSLMMNSLVCQERFRIEEGETYLIEVPIIEKYIPLISVEVTLIGNKDRIDNNDSNNVKKRPAFATSSTQLTISKASRTLKVEAEPASQLVRPGAETEVKITVRDNEGRAVSDSEVCVIVVDDSILALTGYSIADPMNTFYTGYYAYVISFIWNLVTFSMTNTLFSYFLRMGLNTTHLRSYVYLPD